MTGTKNDRLQTSTCSVAVLPETRNIIVKLQDRDLKWEYMRASGAGGQVSEGKTNIFFESFEKFTGCLFIIYSLSS